jgi:diketogulonate reductase-like aldo/keto reductase
MGGSEKALSGGTFALKSGIHHIDSAQIYGTEKEAGEAIKKAGLKRDQVYVTTKCMLCSSLTSCVADIQYSTCPVSLSKGPV